MMTGITIIGYDLCEETQRTPIRSVWIWLTRLIRNLSIMVRKDWPNVHTSRCWTDTDGLLERERRSGLMQKPRKQHYRSLVNYLWNRAPIVRSEMTFLKHRDDFVILTGQSESPLERTLDHLICIVPFAWFRVSQTRQKQNNPIPHLLISAHLATLLLGSATKQDW
jgi:hypothetical protein